jgi:hypothetical protein
VIWRTCDNDLSYHTSSHVALDSLRVAWPGAPERALSFGDEFPPLQLCVYGKFGKSENQKCLLVYSSIKNLKDER